MTGGLRVGLVGSGPIADWHVRALKVAGLEVAAVGSRPGSTRVREFAARHAIPEVFDGWTQMLREPGRFDSLVVAIHVDVTPEILEAALAMSVPVLVEKPVAWTSARLEEICQRPHERVIVGYNRRFYRAVQEVRAEVAQGPPVLASMTLPDFVSDPKEPGPRYLRPFFENSCHGVDLLRFVFGSDLRLDAVRRLVSVGGSLKGFSAILSTERGDVVQLLSNWGTPANWSLSVHRPGRRFDLLPFEVGTIYEGMDVIDPTPEFPIRRYLPKLVRRTEIDAVDQREKPGFVAQALALRAMMEGNSPPPEAASLGDALAAVRLCEALVGSPGPGL